MSINDNQFLRKKKDYNSLGVKENSIEQEKHDNADMSKDMGWDLHAFIMKSTNYTQGCGHCCGPALTFTLSCICHSILSLFQESMMSYVTAFPIPWDHIQSAKVLFPH